MVLHCACNLSMLSSTRTPLSYHHFPIFAFDHSIFLHPFCTHFAPILHRFAPFCPFCPCCKAPVVSG